MPRYFTVREAEALLPGIEKCLRDALHHRVEYKHADHDLDAMLKRIRVSGGARVDRTLFLSTRARRDASAAALEDCLEQVERAGAVVKDLDTGLIDFLSIYKGAEVWLCWRLGEGGIEYWHGLEEGFRGRKPIDDDFLRAHGPGAAC